MRIYCDFDGTVTTEDTTDVVLERLAPRAWRDLETDWLEGRLSAAQCMRRQIAMIGGDDRDLEAAVSGVALRAGFRRFARWCADARVTLVIVSDGVDRFIHLVLARHGLQGLPVVANRLAGRERARSLEQPWARRECSAGAGVCKCHVVASRSDTQLVYVGDGRSDFCVAARADLLFARGALAAFAARRGLAFREYDTFDDVSTALTPLLAARPPRVAHALPA